MIFSFSLMHEPELKTLMPGLTLFIFPVGGLEQHGEHLPLGTKLLQSRDWAERLAKKLDTALPQWNFVLMPLIPLTVDTYTTKTSLAVRPHVVRDALVDQCDGLKRLGFSQFAAITSHLTPKQLSAIEDAAKIVGRGKNILLSLSSALIDAKEVWKSPMIALPKEHAGSFDTGSVMILNPELVKPIQKGLVSVPAPRASAARFIQYFRGQIDGYWGNPSSANTLQTEHSIEQMLSVLVEKMKPVLEQGKGKAAFFSGYRHIPFNGSFFKAYFLASIFFIVTFLWMMWGFKDVLE